MTLIPVPDPHAELPAGMDFYRLRREGIEQIADSSGELWTDYNSHDPGITILEALAYAVTDLSYRAGIPIQDILASASTGATADDPYPDQAFFSPRRILTVNPTTTRDFRRLLIDAEPVRNAWVRCDPCGCTPAYSAWYEDGELTISWDPSQRRDDRTKVDPVVPRGLYRVLLELEADPEFGELNDRTITRRRSIPGPFGRPRTVTIEVRFPAWPASREDARRALAAAARGSFQVTAKPLTRLETAKIQIDDEQLHRHWNDVFYVDYRIELDDGTAIDIPDATVRLYGGGEARRAAKVDKLLTWLGDASEDGFVEAYRVKSAMTDAAIQSATGLLASHRNLDEEWGCVELVTIAEIAVCAQLEVDPAADIDLVQARVWLAVEQYFDPPVRFASLTELTKAGVTTDAAFNGPELSNGFLTDEVMRETDLRSQLRTSDTVDLLMEIDGVLGVSGLLLTAYDADGVEMLGIADPDWDKPPSSAFDVKRTSAKWLLVLPPDHRARLHRGLSRFSFTSGGLPFTPRVDEAEDTLVQLRGAAARPKVHAGELDVRPPIGTRRELEAYEPVQHGFPLTYGIGKAGLPSTANATRRAQAKQLKGYLMVYEQLLRNAHAQLAHAPDLFCLDSAIDATYFTGDLEPSFPVDPEKEGVIGYKSVAHDTLTPDVVARLAESRPEFFERRNRFLDHLLARFGESFRDYAMMLADLKGESKSGPDLVRDKLAYLRALPRIGHDRGKAFDRTVSPTDPDNASGLQQRVHLLLGLPDWTIAYSAKPSTSAGDPVETLTIEERGETILSFDVPGDVSDALRKLLEELDLDTNPREWSIEGIDGTLTLTMTVAGRKTSSPLLGSDAGPAARTLGIELARAQRRLLAQAIDRDSYGMYRVGASWRVTLRDAAGTLIARTLKLYSSRAKAGGFMALAAMWAAHKRSILVEHLLLRPKFPGDALYPVGAEGHGCADGCGDDDPYSFRLTYVLPGWTEPFSNDMSVRGYAHRTIEEQTPSHLLVKTCWVADDGYIRDECDPVIDRIAEVLRRHLPGDDDRCRCADEVEGVYSAAFVHWWAKEATVVRRPAAARASIAKALGGVVLKGVGCAGDLDGAGLDELRAVVLDHFTDIALRGRQFERFEAAWIAWAEADAEIDWTRERPLDAVIDLLAAAATAPTATRDAVCACAKRMLDEFGIAFRKWMDEKLDTGKPLDASPAFAGVDGLAPCGSLGAPDDVGAAINALLLGRYVRYAEVSYRLSLLNEALSALRSTYPQATLHDCDDGSDFNPVRLGLTALGSN